MNIYQITPYDLYYIKTTFHVGQPTTDFVEEFCDNCQIQSAIVYRINRGASTILKISYMLYNSQYHLFIDLADIDLSFLFLRKWNSQLYLVHRELFRKFAQRQIEDVQREYMSTYWHIDNRPLWEYELAHKWAQPQTVG